MAEARGKIVAVGLLIIVVVVVADGSTILVGVEDGTSVFVGVTTVGVVVEVFVEVDIGVIVSVGVLVGKRKGIMLRTSEGKTPGAKNGTLTSSKNNNKNTKL